MAYKLISKCPVCNSNLRITRLKCPKCSTVIENDFEFSRLMTLSSEQLYFVEIFIKCRGNIKDVEKELGISYPTVRAKLDEVVAALGYKVSKPKNEKSSDDIINMLEKGDITPDEAVKLLKEGD